MNIIFRTVLFSLLVLPGICRSQSFSFTDKEKGLQIVYSPQGPKLDSIAAHLLANDIKMVTGNQPAVITGMAHARGNIIVIGNIISPLIQPFKLPKQVHCDVKAHAESYQINVIDTPASKVSKALVIAGSDARGTAYGVFSISKKIGVSPWYWWADVPVKQQKDLTLRLHDEYRVGISCVKYRGIFINDEDWGLRPWAAKTVEPETGNIGPKTYAKVFELLLRLQANLLWPAMHPGTQPFFLNPENKKLAEAYAIVIGSSHAEPMLRNNVGEWDEKTMGPFNYITNKDKVYQYWESRVKETTSNEVIYTMGMRGVHDSGMEGVKNAKEAVPLLQQIIKDQRALLQKYRGKPADSIPQAFTAYKEVLDIYDNGLKLPDDITLVWPDDNYGYIQRLSNEKERGRFGGAGIYYHASYWGRPHDYLWLSTTHPALMYEEMEKASTKGANTIRVLNVGDIKPQEYIMDLFLTMGCENLPGVDSNGVRPHLEAWNRSIFGTEHAAQITKVLWQYYAMAFERRPEFMGWSRTEPTTQTTTTAYNHFFYGDEAQRRIDQYESLEKQVKEIRAQIAPEQAAAFYQLVYYPVMCASWMNKKFLYRDKAIFYAKQNRVSAKDYAGQSKAMYDSIVKETGYYNNLLSGGKWKNIMSMKPRDLPVYQEPVIPDITIDGTAGWSIAPEGFVTKDSSLIDMSHGMQLPAFDNVNQQRYFVDVFLNDKKPVDWSAIPSHNYIRLSISRGSLTPEWGKNQVRIWVDIDWTKAPKNQFTDTIVFKGGGKQLEVAVLGHQLIKPKQGKVFVENNGFVSIHAASSENHGGLKYNDLIWRGIPGLGYTGKVLQVTNRQANESRPFSLDPAHIKKHNAWLEYNFYTYTAAQPVVTVYTLPAHPIDNSYSDRYAVSVDDGPLTIVDFKTEGRSEEWKQNVLSNRAARDIQLPFLKNGGHKLKIYCIDPGVMLDEIRIDLGGLKKAYGTLPETTPKNNN
jgi:hypothetical protein